MLLHETWVLFVYDAIDMILLIMIYFPRRIWLLGSTKRIKEIGGFYQVFKIKIHTCMSEIHCFSSSLINLKSSICVLKTSSPECNVIQLIYCSVHVENTIGVQTIIGHFYTLYVLGYCRNIWKIHSVYRKTWSFSFFGSIGVTGNATPFWIIKNNTRMVIKK